MEFVMDNVVGTVNILDFARKYQPGLDRFVYFSTDEVFGEWDSWLMLSWRSGFAGPAPRGVSYAEYDRYNSGNPYSAGKSGGEEFAVTDVNEELIARMTADEKERYTQIFQDFYSHMYD